MSILLLKTISLLLFFNSNRVYARFLVGRQSSMHFKGSIRVGLKQVIRLRIHPEQSPHLAFVASLRPVSGLDHTVSGPGFDVIFYFEVVGWFSTAQERSLSRVIFFVQIDL